MEPVKFIHMADLHLGKKQYNLEQRYKDYFNTFKWILDLSIREQVDFIMISGDLFDNRKIGPSVLSDLFYILQKFNKKCLEILKRKIQIICIEGNHDNPIYTSRSWMSFLADLDLIILLSGNFDKATKKVEFPEFNSKTKRGGKIRIKGVEIYGLPFYGSYTNHLFPYIYKALSDDDFSYRILMMHFGIQGYDETKPGVRISNDLEKLKEKIDYLALGHYHRQYYHPRKGDAWIFNPGSIEINDIRESRFEHGIIIAEITGREDHQKNINLIPCDLGDNEPGLIPNRKFTTISSIDISNSSSFEKSIKYVLNQLKKHNVEIRDSNEDINYGDLNIPILAIFLKGNILYSRLEININKLREEIKKQFEVLDVKIYTNELYSEMDNITIEDDNQTIEEIELNVFTSLIRTNPDYGGLTSEVADLVSELKSELLTKSPNYEELKEMLKSWASIHIPKYKNIEKEVSIESSNDEKTKTVKLQDLSGKEKEVLEKQKGEEKESFDDEFGIDLDDYIDDGEDDF
ncbi:MAG: hypothetical protein GF353_21295 [Candidatus Lokiarchaeota archaeon]|nr:hypothetical protein [Candidatus Lokiarchaeota archaeon]